MDDQKVIQDTIASFDGALEEKEEVLRARVREETRKNEVKLKIRGEDYIDTPLSELMAIHKREKPTIKPDSDIESVTQREKIPDGYTQDSESEDEQEAEVEEELEEEDRQIAETFYRFLHGDESKEKTRDASEKFISTADKENSNQTIYECNQRLLAKIIK